MKKLLVIAVIAVMGAAAATFVIGTKKVSANLDLIFTESVDALAGSEGGAMVICRCGSFLGRGCKASHKGSTCAGGDNVKCWDYDGNC